MNSLATSPIKAEGEAVDYQVLDEVIKAYKPLTPQQQRIKSLQTQKDNVSKQLKAERDRQKIQKAQQTIQSVASKN
jgi:seryl-tRNA synthetase